MTTTALSLWRNANVASFATEALYGWQEGVSIVGSTNGIEWIGPLNALPPALRARIEHESDCAGACLTPSLIDCHTHLVYAGNRAQEFERRLHGESYASIAKQGGGIRTTVTATRQASDDRLLSLALARARALMAEGVGTIEIKSGYGLTKIDELRCLRVARRIPMHLPITVHTTFLGAHALPSEFAGRSDDYVSAVCEWLAAAHAESLVDAVDVFCETIGFSRAQTQRVFAVARALGLPVKLHAEQLSDSDGAALAASYDALSCDHLEHLSESGVAAIARAGTVAVLLPGAYYFLRETKLPPVAALRAAGVPIAIATDHNPGSSPTLSPLMMMNMACTLFGLTPEEAWRGFTVNAARALGLSSSAGQLVVGGGANFAIWDASHPRDLVYAFGGRPLKSLVLAGADFNG
jgi:imidazolonepropionase